MTTPDQTPDRPTPDPAAPTPAPQAYAGPIYPPQGYPPYVGAAPTRAPSPVSARGRGLAVTAIILGAVPVLIGLVQPLTARALLSGGDGYALYSLVTFGIAIISLTVGAAALICGLVARRDAPLPAGIGIGLGAAAVANVLGGLVYAALFGA